MSVIDISAGWMGALVPYILRSTTSQGNFNPAATGLLQQGNGYPNGCTGTINFMQGSVPTDFSTLTTVGSRASDILCRFQTGQDNAGDFGVSQYNTNPCVIATQYVDAIATGTATWFWWYSAENSISGQPTNASPLVQQAFGTMGLTGSGSDLEMISTSIVAGRPYRILNLRVQFPSIWTY